MVDNYTFKVLKGTDDLELWNNAVNTVDDANIFHTNDWLLFIRNKFDSELIRIIIYRSDNIVGIFPFFKKKYNLLSIAGSPLYLEGTPYMGFVINKNENFEKIISSIYAILKNQGIDYFRASFDNTLYKETFLHLGFNIIEKTSYRLDISFSEEILWSNFKKNVRKNIRKSERNNFVFREFYNLKNIDSYVDSYFNLVKDVFSRQGLPPYIGKSYYKDLFKLIIKNKIGKIYTIENSEGLIVAGLILVFFKNKAYGLDSASLRSYQKFGVNHFLRWNTISAIKGLGVYNYDLTVGGIRGLDQFKKSFGSLPCSVIYVENCITYRSKIAKNIYASFKRYKKKFLYFSSTAIERAGPRNLKIFLIKKINWLQYRGK